MALSSQLAMLSTQSHTEERDKQPKIAKEMVS